MGSANSGTVHLHMAKSPEHPDWQYQLLALDVQGMYKYLALAVVKAHSDIGHPRLYLEKAESGQQNKKAGLKMLGVQWR